MILYSTPRREQEKEEKKNQQQAAMPTIKGLLFFFTSPTLILRLSGVWIGKKLKRELYF